MTIVLPNVAYLTYDGEEDEDCVEVKWSEDRSSCTIDLGLRSRVGLPDSIRFVSELPDLGTFVAVGYKWKKKSD